MSPGILQLTPTGGRKMTMVIPGSGLTGYLENFDAVSKDILQNTTPRGWTSRVNRHLNPLSYGALSSKALKIL